MRGHTPSFAGSRASGPGAPVRPPAARPAPARPAGRAVWGLAFVLLLLGLLFMVVSAGILLPAGPAGAAERMSGTPDPTRRLFQAVDGNDLAAVRASVAAGADVHAADALGISPLGLAVAYGFGDIADFLRATAGGRGAGESAALTDEEPAGDSVSPLDFVRGLAGLFSFGAVDPEETRRQTSGEDSGAVRPASLPAPSAAPPSPSRVPVGPVSNAVLSLGRSLELGRTPAPARASPGYRARCIEKQRATVVFCIEPVDWPADIAGTFDVSTILYRGAKAIVRYDNGAAVSIQALFPAASFAAVAAHYRRRLGEPAAAWRGTITPFASPRRANPMVLWRGRDAADGRETILEVRQYDDTRGGFPDTRHGTVRLHRPGAPPIFPRLSQLDLMMLQSNLDR